MSVPPANMPDLPPDPATPPFTRDQLLVLAGITLLAAVLRLFRLEEWSLWVDEAHTFRDATSDLDVFWASNVSKYPVSALTLRWLLEHDILRATGEGWLRLPFAFLGILTIPAVGLFGRAIVGRGPALLAAAFLAVHPWHIYWSQNVRGYALNCFFATLAAFLTHRAVRRRSIPMLLAAMVCVGISGMAHPSGFIMLTAIGAFAAFEIWRDRALRRWLFRPLPSGVLGVLAIALGIWFVPAFWHAAAEKPDASLIHLVQTFAWFIGPGFAVAAAAGLACLPMPGRVREAGFLAAWTIVPTLALMVLGAFFIKATARFGLFLAPALCLLAAQLCFVVSAKVDVTGWRRKALRWALPAVLLVEFLGYDALYYTQQYGDRPRWREAARIVQHEAAGRTLVITHHQPSMEYYLDRAAFYEPGRNPALVENLIEGFTDWKFNQAGIDFGGGGEEYLRQWADVAMAQSRALFVVYSTPEVEAYDLGTRTGTHEGKPFRHESGEFDRAVRRFGHQVAYLSNDIGPRDLSLQVYRIPLPLPERD